MKYMATSSLANASARQRAAALTSESFRTRASPLRVMVALSMDVAVETDLEVEAEVVDSMVMAAFIFSILTRCGFWF